MGRNPNYRLVKIHRNYTVEEVALLFGKHKNTVRAWIKEGLQPIDARRPTLIHGRELAGFLRQRRLRGSGRARPVICFASSVGRQGRPTVAWWTTCR